MTKFDRSMTNKFRKIHKEHGKRKIDAIQIIRRLGNILLELQKNVISTSNAYSTFSTTKVLFKGRHLYNTYPLNEHTLMLKPMFLLKQEDDNSKDVMCHCNIDYYIEHPHAIRQIFLA